MTPAGPWSLLRRYTGPQKWSVVFMSVLLLGTIGLALAEPSVIRQFIIGAQQGATDGTLIVIAVVFLVVAGARQAVRALAVYWSERVGWTATNQLRSDLLEHVLGLDLTYHESRSPGELIERIDGDVNIVNTFFSSFVVDSVGNVLLLLGILIALTLLNPLIGLCFAVLTVMGMLLLVRVSTIATPSWQADRQQSAMFYGELGEILRATEDVRSLAAEDFAMGRFFRRIRAWLPVEVRASVWATSVWVVTIFLFTSAVMLAYGLGGTFYSQHSLSLGDLFLVVAYALMLTGPMEALRNQLDYLQRAAAAVQRICELLAVRSSLVNGTRDLPAGALAVELRGVSFAYPSLDGENGRSDVVVFPNLDFSLAPGQTLGLVGRTGAGKSTIANLLFRNYDPQAGAVRIGGYDVRDLRLESLRARIGLVTQEVHIFAATLRDNLTFFDESIGDDRLMAALRGLGLAEWLARLPDGLDTHIAADSLSAGEAQLVAFARVFLKEPGLIVLDEPSSRLDPVTEGLLGTAIDALLEDRTAILITHRLETLRRADEIILIDEGQILERGATADLLGDGASQFATLLRAREGAS